MASTRTTSLMVAAIVALAFGALTVLSGGRALFGSAEAQAAVGNAVPLCCGSTFWQGLPMSLRASGYFCDTLLPSGFRSAFSPAQLWWLWPSRCT